MKARCLLLLVAGLLMTSCKEKSAETSFYFWRTNYELSKAELETLRGLSVKHIYVRAFDVDAASPFSGPKPLAVVENSRKHPVETRVIPVVFITNRTFKNIGAGGLRPLAENIANKCRLLFPGFSELQIDCDWSDRTRENYFKFLEELGRLLQPGGTELSCTVRLHQVKYAHITGIPPVKGALLMFYNMGKVNDPNESNSLFNAMVAQRYLAFLRSYPLHLDVGLPIFQWQRHFRNNRLIELLSKKRCVNLADTMLFSTLNSTNFTVKKDGFINSTYFRKGDIIKCESVSTGDLMVAGEMLAKRIKPGVRRIVYFDLDEINLNRYETETFEEVTSCFN